MKHILVTFITLVLILLVGYFSYLPGDLALTINMQRIISNKYGWANYISTLANFPWYLILLFFSFTSSFLLTKNSRIALLSLISFGGIWALDKILKTIIFRPRPPHTLIHVSQQFSGSSFPSTSATIFGATIGFILMLIITRRSILEPFINISIGFCCSIMLFLIFIARVILGAHWPSDIIISYIITFLWINFILRFV